MEQMTVDGFEFIVSIEIDHDQDTPWDNEEGHGPVSDWTSRDKLPGELVLNSDRGSKRFYDFAAACRMARKDGWGFLPGNLDLSEKGGIHTARVRFHPDLTASDSDINAAIGAVYAKHRASMTARQYAAGAAMRDFEWLRAWCDDKWRYVGVVVTCSDLDASESLWGIASDDDSYIETVARELADQIISDTEAAVRNVVA